MTENVKKIFGMLNLEPYEDFKIDGFSNIYYIDDNLEIYVRTPRMVLKCPKILIEIINNPKSIIKLPRESKKKKLRDLTPIEYRNWKLKNCDNFKTCDNCPFKCVSCTNIADNCWAYHKELYSDVFLDQEVEL